MAKLKPCPFCGEKAKLVTFNDKKTDDIWYTVRCSNPNCVGFYINPQYSYEGLATDKWNRRAEDGK